MRRIALLTAAVIATSLLAVPAVANDAPSISRPVSGVMAAGAGVPVRFTGAGAFGSNVDLVDAATGEQIGTAPVTEAGTWSVDLPLADGEHTAYAIQGVGASSPVNFVVDAVRPDAVIKTPSNHKVFAPLEPTAFSGEGSDDRGVLAVQLEYYLADKLVLRKNAPCDGCGGIAVTWTDEPALPLPGYYVLKATAIDLAGNRGETRSLGFFTSGVNYTPAPLPQTPNAPAPPQIQTPNPDEILAAAGNKSKVTVGGVTQPGTKVGVVETSQGTHWWGTTVGDSRTGRWTLTVSVPPGEYAIQATAIDARGRKSKPSLKVAFAVDGQRPLLEVTRETDPQVFLPTEEVVLSGSSGDNLQVFAVQLEYWLGSRMVLVDNAVCDGCGEGRSVTWTHRPALREPGYYVVKITAIDAAGNRSVTDSQRLVKTL